MSVSDKDVRDALRGLKLAPQHVRRASSGLTDEELGRRPDTGSWSVNEIVAHLRGCADVQGGWIARMLAEDTPTIRYASPRTGMRKGNYSQQPFGANLRGFAEQRTTLVKNLASLAADDWCRGASFTGTTPGWTLTVLEVVRRIATHERAHFDQITAAVVR